MILPDVNVLVYAYRQDMADHEQYRDWVTRIVNARRPYGISELVLSSFVRVVTNRRVFRNPSTPSEALSFTVICCPRRHVFRSDPARGIGTFSTGCVGSTT